MEKKYTIEELERMVDTHTLLPDGSVKRKPYRAINRKNIVWRKKNVIPQLKNKSDNCICMDCGKIIKTTNQSKHLRECAKEPKC